MTTTKAECDCILNDLPPLGLSFDKMIKNICGANELGSKFWIDLKLVEHGVINAPLIFRDYMD